MKLKDDIDISQEVDNERNELSYCCCFSDSDLVHIQDILTGMKKMYNMEFVNLRHVVPEISDNDAISQNRIACALICVSTTFARDTRMKPLLDKVLSSTAPKVSIIIRI